VLGTELDAEQTKEKGQALSSLPLHESFSQPADLADSPPQLATEPFDTGEAEAKQGESRAAFRKRFGRSRERERRRCAR
jgi:hypothetical protein